MNDSGPGPDEVGSVAEEAAKLIGALSGWARDHGEGLPSGLGHGLADAAHGLSGAAHNVNEHFATGGDDCTYCPICRGVRFVRGATPEVRAHLLTAASSLLQAGAVLMATQAPTPEGSGRRTSSVEHIDLDGDLDRTVTADPDGAANDMRPSRQARYNARQARPTNYRRVGGPAMTGLACGIDVGGTKIAGCVVDTDGTILEQARVESPATSTDAIEQAIEELVRGLQRDHEIASVGVGAAGFVDKGRAVVMFAPNLAWRDETLKTDLEARLGLPVVVENDANAAAWGEFEFGAGKDVDDLLLVTVGTGVGGGIVLDGELYRGAFGVAAEIGHIRVERNGRLCGCGNHGCLEQYGSGTALVREAREAIEGGSLLAKDLLDRAGGDLDAITGPMISSAAADGDKFALEQLTTLGEWLGEGIASLAAVLDPAVAVIGGGVSEAGSLLLDPIRTTLRNNLTGRGHRPELEIRKAQLGNTAGMIGAADLARRPPAGSWK